VSREPWDDAVRDLLAPVRELEPTDDAVRRALARGAEGAAARPEPTARRRRDALPIAAVRRTRRRHRASPPGSVAAPLRRRPLALAALLAAVLGVAVAAVAAVPPTRAAVDDLYATISGWVSGDGRGLGRALRPDDAVPDWIRQAPGEQRVVATAGGVNLVVAREDDDTFSVALGSSFGQSGSVEDWRERLAANPVVLLGPASVARDRPFDARGRRPLFGLSARAVTRVVLRYASGPPSVDRRTRGGFGLLADAARPLRDLTGYDRDGRVVGRLDLRDYELRVCREVRGCPPGRLEPEWRAAP
jgi:hypothetical protein